MKTNERNRRYRWVMNKKAQANVLNTKSSHFENLSWNENFKKGFSLGRWIWIVECLVDMKRILNKY